MMIANSVLCIKIVKYFTFKFMCTILVIFPSSKVKGPTSSLPVAVNCFLFVNSHVYLHVPLAVWRLVWEIPVINEVFIPFA